MHRLPLLSPADQKVMRQKMTRLPTTSSTRDRNACCICCRASTGDNGEPSARCVAAAGGCFIHDRPTVRPPCQLSQRVGERALRNVQRGCRRARGRNRSSATARRPSPGPGTARTSCTSTHTGTPSAFDSDVFTGSARRSRTLLRERRRRSSSASGRWPRGRDGMSAASFALTVLHERQPHS